MVKSCVFCPSVSTPCWGYDSMIYGRGMLIDVKAMRSLLQSEISAAANLVVTGQSCGNNFSGNCVQFTSANFTLVGGGLDELS
ncbi:hypothetical protein QL285_073086 [Trifolium repens]|nr:hypothetical protein QL285_073086 [Trifolium repens]